MHEYHYYVAIICQLIYTCSLHEFTIHEYFLPIM